MKNKIEYKWDEENKVATCILTDKITNKKFVGIATCHPDDTNKCKESRGQELALHRAIIKFYKEEKSYIKRELGALNQLLYSINKSKKYNKKSYEAKMLFRQINQRQQDIELLNELIKMEKKHISMYIKILDKYVK